MDLREKTGLLIDDMAEMRTTVRVQLADGGLEKCEQARNIKEAIDKLSANRYDLVVCDYNLGQGADGQQLLELVRRRQLLPMTTAFLMITGETGYEQVSTAVEYAPDDYLLKPFTAETLRTRIERIFERKEAMKSLYRHMGGTKSDTQKALAACDALLAQNTRYQLDVLRIKGDMLLKCGRYPEALTLFRDVLQQRATPWAKLGEARCLAATGAEEEAMAGLKETLQAYPNYLQAYDSLAGLLEKTDKKAAQAVVEQALKVAGTTQRQRALGTLAFENKDFQRAEEAYRRVVDKDRTGFFKSHDDYAGLAKTFSEQGKGKEALDILKDMGTAFARSPELAARQAAVECQVHMKSGNAAAAKIALEKAFAAQKDVRDPSTSLEIAQACFASGDPDKAKSIIQAVAEDHHENEAVIARAQSVFAAAGRPEEGAIFLDSTRKGMIKLNNDAVALAKSGELDRAIGMLGAAADRLANNCQVALNAALALLLHLQKNGVDSERLSQAQRYLQQARRINRDHPKLPEVLAFYRKVAPPGTPDIED
jgi:DNA-binding response OmpR family regulator